MRLTLWTDYALRTLMFVAVMDDKACTIAEIAETFAVSKTHLMKVVNKLVRQGYLVSSRGRGGGVRLARPAADIRIGDVVRETEEDLAVVGCLAEPGFCRIEDCCILQGALREATLAFLDALDGYTLADLLVPRARLARSLGLVGDAGRTA